MLPFRPRLRWLAPLALLVSTAGALGWLIQATRAVRLEARERFFEQYNRQQVLLAEQAAHSVEELFDTYRRQLSLVASLFEGQEVTPESVRRLRGSLDKVHASLAGTPVIDLAVFDRRGTVLLAIPGGPGAVGTNLAYRDYFAWARDRGRPGQVYVSPFRTLMAGKARGQKALVVAEGIYGRRGEFNGLTLFAVNFSELAAQHILSVRIGEQGYAWLMDTVNRTVLVHPWGRVSGRSFDELFLLRWPHLYQQLIAAGNGRPGTLTYEFADAADPSRSIRKVAGYAPVRVGQHQWLLGVGTPEREVEALMTSFLRRQELWSTATGAVISLSAVGVLGVLLGWNRTLAREVDVRTRELAKARSDLVAAEKMAVVGQMALGLAHEVRNPLSAIRMNVQMIREESPGDLRENFDIVEGEILRLNKLLADVMGFARPRPLRLGEADLAVEAWRVVRLLGRQLVEEGVQVEVDADEPVPVLCDVEQIRQVLLNLCLNGVAAMRDVAPPKRLIVGARREGEFAVLRVSDTGPGVRPEHRGRVFDPFFTTKAEGGGLGLATVQSIVLRHGGRVEIEEGGEGAAFMVRLPRAALPAEGRPALPEESP